MRYKTAKEHAEREMASMVEDGHLVSVVAYGSPPGAETNVTQYKLKQLGNLGKGNFAHNLIATLGEMKTEKSFGTSAKEFVEDNRILELQEEVERERARQLEESFRREFRHRAR